MEQNKRKDTVFLPIKPRYARAIMSGEKRVEFRKKFPAEVKHVVVYSSSPEKKILGWFNVNAIEVTEPLNAWKRYQSVGSISKEDFFDYYENNKTATVIKVEQFFSVSEDVPAIKELGITPPQSYCYVENHVWKTLQKYKQ